MRENSAGIAVLHGPFGAGKTRCLSAIGIAASNELRDKSGFSREKVCFAAACNNQVVGMVRRHMGNAQVTDDEMLWLPSKSYINKHRNKHTRMIDRVSLIGKL